MYLEYPYDVRYAALKLAIANTPGGCHDCQVKDALAYVLFLDQESDWDDDDDVPRAPKVPDPSVKNSG